MLNKCYFKKGKNKTFEIDMVDKKTYNIVEVH